MAELQLPVCSTLFLLLLCSIYFSKKKLKTLENKLYSIMLIAGLIDSIIVSIERFLVLDGNLNNVAEMTTFILQITNKLDFIALIILTTVFFLYTFLISFNNAKNIFRKIVKITIVIDIIICSIICFLSVDLISSNGVISVTGGATIPTYILCGLYILSSVIITFINLKKVSKKHIPIFGIIFLFIILLFVYKSNPYIMVNSIVITFVTYLMYFTMENPDVKILDEVHRAKEISDNANEEKTMFLYNMTNEIRNITKDIDYSADTILDETDNKKVDMEVINDSAREIKGSTAKFTTMTNEILDISSIDSTSVKIYNDKYNIKLIIKELVQIYKGKCENKGLSFRTSIASDIPEYLYGDSVGLKKVLSVILDNSVDYTESGYIEFNVSTIIKRDIARLIITVEDSGTGIKAEELDKIFNRRNNKEDKLNLDNNLYNARRLITLMNGTIIPNSAYGKGTTMKIVLDQKIAIDSTSNLEKYESLYDKKKILLVDDNDASGKIISKLINDTNINLDIVTTGKECLDKIRNKEKYDLILLDEDMEPLDGITVMKKLKEIRNFNTYVILLTKNNDYEYNDDYLKYGFSDYLLKPLEKDRLLEKMDKYLK